MSTRELEAAMFGLAFKTMFCVCAWHYVVCLCGAFTFKDEHPALYWFYAIGGVVFVAILACHIIMFIGLFDRMRSRYIAAERRAQAFGADPKENLEDIDCG